MKGKKNALEWAVFAVGLLLTVGLVAFLAYDALHFAGRPPALQVVLGRAERHEGRFIVPVTVVNEGERTAEDVEVEVRLLGHDGQAERAELTFPFVPRQARREGWVSVAADPAAARRMEAHVVSYRKP